MFVEIDREIDDLITNEVARYRPGTIDYENFKATLNSLGDTKRLSEEMKRFNTVYTIDLSEEKSLGG